MCLIFVRGLAWQYTAETIAIVVVEFIMAYLVQSDTMTTKTAVFVMLIFPLSLVLVATLEHLGFNRSGRTEQEISTDSFLKLDDLVLCI